MNAFRRGFAVLAGLVVALTTGAAVAEAGPGTRPEPAQPIQKVVLIPASGPAGTRVLVSGQLGATCAAATSVTVEWAGSEIASGLGFTVPDGSAAGSHVVQVRCVDSDGVDSSDFAGSARFTVEAAPDRTDPPTQTDPPRETDPAGRTDPPRAGNPEGQVGPGQSAPGPGVEPSAVPEPSSSHRATSAWAAVLVVAIGVLVVVVRLVARRRSSAGGEPSGLRLVAVRGPVTGPIPTPSRPRRGLNGRSGRRAGSAARSGRER